MPEVKLMAAVIRRYEITDEEWERIKPYIPEEQEAGARGRPSEHGFFPPQSGIHEARGITDDCSKRVRCL